MRFLSHLPRTVLSLAAQACLGVLVLCASLSAHALDLFVWHMGARQVPPLILPVPEGQTPDEAASRYLGGLRENSDLRSLFGGKQLTLIGSTFEPLSETDSAKRVLLLGNNSTDQVSSNERVKRFSRIFKDASASVYLLPVAAGIALSDQDNKDLHQAVIDRFPLLVAMGGADVDPRFYQEANRLSVETNPTRDQYEVSLIRDYVKAEKGFFLGVCRGHQLTSIALGYKMVQDITTEIKDPGAHRDGWHSIELLPTTHGLLSSILPGQSRWTVNTFHHQSVIFKPGGFLELAARSPDGVTEALEFKNGLGLLLQFHPEYMDNELGTKILNQVLTYRNRQLRNRSCSAIFTSAATGVAP